MFTNQIITKKKEHRSRTYIVLIDLNAEEYTCICAKFEKDGLLCSHILKVMLEQKIKEIPDKYIIERWRKRERKKEISSTSNAPVADNVSLRFNILSRRLADIASKGARTEGKYNFVLTEIARMEDLMDNIDAKEQPQSSTDYMQSNGNVQINGEDIDSESIVQVQDPDVANTKGRPLSNKRWMPTVEKILSKQKYNCGHCGGAGHNVRDCKFKHLKFDLSKKKQKRKKKDSSTTTEGKKRTIPAVFIKKFKVTNKKIMTEFVSITIV